jgi:hypothetical protein
MTNGNCLTIINWNKKSTYLGKRLFKNLLGMSGNGRFFDIGTMLTSYDMLNRLYESSLLFTQELLNPFIADLSLSNTAL